MIPLHKDFVDRLEGYVCYWNRKDCEVFKLKVIITMAGEGSRMKKFNLPKHMVKVMGKTLFEWSIGSLKNFLVMNSYS